MHLFRLWKLATGLQLCLSGILCRVSKEELVKLIFPLGPAVLGLALSLTAQQAPPATQNPDTTTAQPQPEVDTAMQRRSAQSFEGKITRSGEKLVLRENASKIAYQLDDQEKARKYEGRDVKVMGTLEAPIICCTSSISWRWRPTS